MPNTWLTCSAKLERAPEFDMVLYAIPTWGPHDAQRLLPGFLAAAQASKKPTVISAWTAANLTQHAETVLAAGESSYFGSVDAALTALSNLARWSHLRATAAKAPTARVAAAAVPRPGELPELPNEHQAKTFLCQQGLRGLPGGPAR